MKSSMKTVCTLIAALTALSASAGNQLDGVYACSVSWSDQPAQQVFFAVITNAQGQTATAPVAVSVNNPLFGYGVGNATPSSFVGTTMYGLPFSFTASAGGFSGSTGLMTAGGAVMASATCGKVW